jgi:hypothetical protein
VEEIPVIRLSSSWTRELLEAAGLSGGPSDAGSAVGGLRLDLRLTMERERRTLRNVVGSVPGHDGWILVSSHYDGLGRKQGLWQGAGAHHPGANDNASGVAVLLELARRLASRDARRGPGILFAATAGEEMGLAGSRSLSANPPVPLEEIAAVVNVEAVGRLHDGALYCFGAGNAGGLGRLVDAAGDADPGLRIVATDDPGIPSDHSPFSESGTPALHVTTLPREDDRRLTDTWDKLDGNGLARVAGFLEALVDSLGGASPGGVPQKGANR